MKDQSDNRISQRNGYYERELTTRIGSLELKVPRTRDGEFTPTVFKRYQRNEKALLASMLEMVSLLVKSLESLKNCAVNQSLNPLSKV